MRIGIVILAAAAVGALVLIGARKGEGAVETGPLRDHLLANRAAGIQYVRAPVAPPTVRSRALRTVLQEKQRLGRDLAALTVDAELEEVRAAAVASTRADARLIEAELLRSETEVAIAASDTGSSEDGGGAGRAAAEQDRDRLDAEIGRLRAEARTRHARLDDLAFKRGLLPFRTSSPF